MKHDPLCNRTYLDATTCAHCMCIAHERAKYAIEQALAGMEVPA